MMTEAVREKKDLKMLCAGFEEGRRGHKPKNVGGL